MKRYKCSKGSATDHAAITAEWEAMHVWMRAHETASNLIIGAPVSLTTGAEMQTTPGVTWEDAWAALPRVDNAGAAGARTAAEAQGRDSARLAGALNRMRGPDREASSHC